MKEIDCCRYNAILFVPFQLERLLWYGLLVCLDSFLVSGLHSLLSLQCSMALALAICRQ